MSTVEPTVEQMSLKYTSAIIFICDLHLIRSTCAGTDHRRKMKLHVSAHLTPRTTRPAPPLAAAAAVHSFKCSLAQLTRHIKPTRQPLAPLRAVNVDPVPSIQIDGEDFYALLRCSPASTKSEIKSAWISRMREFHPDHAVASSVDDANVLCSLLNEIYEVRAGFHGLVFEGPNSPF